MKSGGGSALSGTLKQKHQSAVEMRTHTYTHTPTHEWEHLRGEGSRDDDATGFMVLN